jgi:hypothetical protein
MSDQMIVRIDPALKAKAVSLARTEGKNLSELVRDLLADYVRERDMSAYVGELWDRIGARMHEDGVTQERIAEAVDRVRKEK